MKKNPSLLDFSGKVAIVTGAATGIGEATAHRLAELGATVVCVGLPGDPLEDVAQAIVKRGGKAIAYDADLSNPMEAEACITFTVKRLKRLDILISNAGFAVEQAKYGVRVNVVCPGAIDTAMTHAARTAITKKDEQSFTQNIPMQRRGTVEEIAKIRKRPRGTLGRVLKHTFHGGFKKNNPEPAERSRRN